MRVQLTLWTIHRGDADVECSVEMIGEDLFDLHVDGGEVHIGETFQKTEALLLRAESLRREVERAPRYPA